MQELKYSKVERYLREFGKDEPQYDFVGAMNLLNNLIKNLQNNFTMEFDFEEYACCLEEENEPFLNKLIEFTPISREIHIKENEKYEKEEVNNHIESQKFIESLDKEEYKQIEVLSNQNKLTAIKYLISKYKLGIRISSAIIEHVKNAENNL